MPRCLQQEGLGAGVEPAGWEIAAAVVILQSLVELFGMVVYLWWIPGKLFAGASGE